MERNIYKIGKELFITSDEEIKDGDWWLNLKTNDIDKCTHKSEVLLYNSEKYKHIKKIILTTDQDLINDDVQAIDDEFLEWFVNNPSCEFVEVIQDRMAPMYHDIIIPKEEPKKIFGLPIATNLGNALTASAKCQAERMYSEDEVLDILNEYRKLYGREDAYKSQLSYFVEQFKKK